MTALPTVIHAPRTCRNGYIIAYTIPSSYRLEEVNSWIEVGYGKNPTESSISAGLFYLSRRVLHLLSIKVWFLIISVSHQMHCSRHPMEVHTVRFFIFSTTSTSEFASDLCAYLSNYHLDGVNFWIDRIRNCDFSEVSDRLVFSVPGYHPSDRMDKVALTFLLPLLVVFLK